VVGFVPRWFQQTFAGLSSSCAYGRVGLSNDRGPFYV
jgi:hypothetical protein